jgi:hypothetical protein
MLPSTQTLEERVQALVARLAQMDALREELASLKVRITKLEAAHHTAPTIAHAPQPSIDHRVEIDVKDHRPYQQVPEQGRFFYKNESEGFFYCKLCKRQDHSGAHFSSQLHQKKASDWFSWAKQWHPEEFPDQHSFHGNQNSSTPAHQYLAPAPAPALRLLDGQTTLDQAAPSGAGYGNLSGASDGTNGQLDGQAPTSSSTASDARAGYGNLSGASDGTGGHPTPWASGSSSGWANASWTCKHWGK